MLALLATGEAGNLFGGTGSHVIGQRLESIDGCSHTRTKPKFLRYARVQEKPLGRQRSLANGSWEYGSRLPMGR